MTGFFRRLQMGAKEHSPEIRMILGIGGMITTVIFAVKATPAALELIHEARVKKSIKKDAPNHPELEKLTPVETVKAAWECYIPSAVIAGVSIYCLASSMDVSLERTAALATAYGISESAMKTYQEKVIETIGPKKEQEIRDEVAKDRLNKREMTGSEVLLIEDGKTLCYDVYTDKFFHSDMHRIKQAVIDLNFTLLQEDFVPMADFYYEIGLNDIPAVSSFGWHIDQGQIELAYSSILNAKGEPCLSIEFRTLPRNDFRY